jgi:formate hydrogenlyase subunit 3/multisubunit Na+/H+ antiporter MnhD subunit
MTASAVVVPFAGAALAFAAPRRLGRKVAVLTAGVIVAVVVKITLSVWSEGPHRTPVGGWGAPLGIDLYVDGLSAAMLLMSALIGLCITLYALGYFAPEASSGWSPADAFWPLLLLLWGALNALLLSADIFNVYVALEAMTLAAVALVVLAGERVALTAGMRYLLAAFLGSMGYLFGVALLYASFHTLDIQLLGERMVPGLGAWSAVALITLSLAVKTALFPLHFWLPRAHASAPAPVSALLSTVVVTASFYILLRLWFEAFPAAITGAAAQFLGALGAAAIIWGSLQAVRQQRLKLMVAYSTVAQVGYLFLLFPLAISGDGSGGAISGSFDGWSGGIYHALSHGFAKAAMFLAAGSIAHSLGDDRIVGISGIATSLPISTYAFGLAGLSLIGLPPSGGFVAKWLMLSAALTSGQWWWAVVILLGGLLTAGYVFLVIGQELSEAPSDQPGRFVPVPRVMEYAALALALAAMLLGLRAVELLRLLEIGSPFFQPL